MRPLQRSAAAVVALAMFAAVVLVLARHAAPSLPAEAHAQPGAATATDAPQAQATAESRTAVDRAPATEFTCTDDDGEPIADAMRDGLVIEVRDADDRPCGDCRVGLYWRKDSGVYGWDRGRTAADGSFATTAGELWMFDTLEFEHPHLGRLVSSGAPILPSTDPRRVKFVVPPTAVIEVTVLDLAGQVVPQATVECTAEPEPLGPRDNVLSLRPSSRTTNGEGRLTLRLPVGACELAARIRDDEPAQIVDASVPPPGGSIDLLVLRRELRIDVDVELVLPPGVAAPGQVAGWGHEPLPRPASPLVRGVEPRPRDYGRRRLDARHFRFRVDPLPWRLFCDCGEAGFGRIDVAAGQRQVRLVVSPPSSPAAATKAQLLVQVFGADGEPVSYAYVRVHTRPDLASGSDQVVRDKPFAITLPATGKRVCLSARADGMSRAISEPIALTPGEHLVELHLGPGGDVDVSVVDGNGVPVESDVCLRRPAGPMQGLADDVPTILGNSAPGDSYSGVTAPIRFRDLGPGDHELWAFPEHGGWPAHAIVRAGDTVVLHPGDGCQGLALLTIQVVDAVSEQPIDHVDLRVRGGFYTPRRAGPDAPFRCAVPDGAEVSIRAEALDHVIRSETVQVTAGAPPHVVRLAPSPLRFVRLRRTDGSPLADVELRAVDDTGTELEFPDPNGFPAKDHADTDRFGRAVLRGLPATACRLIAARGDQRREFELLATDGLDAVFDLIWRD